MRIGLGYDIHPLVSGRRFILGGVSIEFHKGPKGHSDGDCLLHALTDALLGAAGLGDMGHFFPDTDPKWKDADSAHFLQESRRLLKEKGFQIENIDAILHLQSPELAPHLSQIVGRLSEILGLPAERINLKAKRGEGLGEVGRGEAIAAQVVVLLR